MCLELLWRVHFHLSKSSVRNLSALLFHPCYSPSTGSPFSALYLFFPFRALRDLPLSKLLGTLQAFYFSPMDFHWNLASHFLKKCDLNTKVLLKILPIISYMTQRSQCPSMLFEQFNCCCTWGFFHAVSFAFLCCSREMAGLWPWAPWECWLASCGGFLFCHSVGVTKNILHPGQKNSLKLLPMELLVNVCKASVLSFKSLLKNSPLPWYHYNMLILAR